MATKKVVSKSVQRRVAVQKSAVAKKPVREVQKAPLGELLVALDRVVTFLDHAVTALNAQSIEFRALKLECANLKSAPTHGGIGASPVVSVKKDPVETPPPAAPSEVEHTASYNIATKKMIAATSHEVIEIVLEQVNASTKLTKEEQVELRKFAAERKNEIPF